MRTIANKLLLLLSILSLLSACSKKINQLSFPSPVDTHDKHIQFQTKKIYTIPSLGIYADNLFDGAKMDDCQLVNDSIIQISILPENTPINESPYFAFRLWSDTLTTIQLSIRYTASQHRYWPKYSLDGSKWDRIDSSAIHYNSDSTAIFFTLMVPKDTIWIAAQEILNSTHNLNWIKTICEHPHCQYKKIGLSVLGKAIWMMDIHDGNPNNKDMIVLMSRQHPPEISGYLAMEKFVETILEENNLSHDFIKKYRILVIPMINPDGVDLGHWRHNAKGIDLNRDWQYYRQNEVSAVVHAIDSVITKDHNNLILGIDFHSTQKDLYYTLPKDLKSKIYPFTNYWIEQIGADIEGYQPLEFPDKIGKPVSKTWFYLKYSAEGITYEIGDETNRSFIDLKASIAAKEMMKLLILR